MGRLTGFKHRQIIIKLKKLGFKLDRQVTESHEIWINPSVGKYTIIPTHSGTIPEGRLKAILKQSGVSSDQFLEV